MSRGEAPVPTLLAEEELDEAHALGLLAFGVDPATPRSARPGQVWGVAEGGRLVAKARLHEYAQWWGGRPVRMGGVAGVAVHPDARGTGLAAALLRTLLEQMTGAGQVVSALFPTRPGIYRSLGWEVAGSLDTTVLPVRDLRATRPAGISVRSAGLADVPELQRLWNEHGAATNGQLTRVGPHFPQGARGALEASVVALAEEGGRAVGYASYDRGAGYGPESALELRELVSAGPGATAALVHSLSGWEAVVGAVRWRGPVDELQALLPGAVPAPNERQPWMLRIVDAPAAVAARGFVPGPSLSAAVHLVDPQVPRHEGPWRLEVEGGSGRLERLAVEGLPRLDVRGLAALWAGAADTGQLLRTGLLDRPLPALDLVFAGPRAQLLDYF